MFGKVNPLLQLLIVDVWWQINRYIDIGKKHAFDNNSAYWYSATHRLTQFQVTHFSYLRSEVKKTDVKDSRVFFYFPEWNRNEKEVAGENCWAMTQATGVSCCGQSGCTVSESVFQLDCLIHKCKSEHMWFKPAQSSICAMQSAKYVMLHGLFIFQNFSNMIPCTFLKLTEPNLKTLGWTSLRYY